MMLRPSIAAAALLFGSSFALAEQMPAPSAANTDPLNDSQAAALMEADQNQAPARDTPLDVKPVSNLPELQNNTTPADVNSTAPTTATSIPVNQWTADLINQAEWTEDLGKGQFPVYAKAQILLDRGHSSPGVIDGISGRNMLKAISAFELMQGLPIDGVLDAEVWAKLKQFDTSPVMQTYTLTEADIKGPYAPSIPHDYAEQAKMKGLYYTSVVEMLGERFHMDENFIRALNPNAKFNQVGEQLVLADFGEEDTRPLSLLIAHKGASELYGFDENNKMIVAYPATIGSADTPSPSGTVKVKAIAPNPWYGYNPKNFIQGKNLKPLSLPPGPNNPVGSMWIGLSKPSYGIHGTPSPAKIDKTRSHGCVRLTNWDAEALAKRIKPGITVQFR